MISSRGTILVLDDESASLALVSDILTRAGYQVRPADSARLALASAAMAPPDLVLLDMRLPEMSGLEVCRQLKAAESTCQIPVIFISAATETDERVRALSLGAVDFIAKPFESNELLARVRTHLELARLRSGLEVQVATRTQNLLRAVEQLRREVEERERTVQTLRESEGRFGQIADAAPVMIVTFGPDEQAIFFNKGWLDFTGRTLDQELGTGWTAGVHPDDLQLCLGKMAASFASRTECQLEYRLRRADGEYRWVICRGVPRFEPGGDFAGYIASLVDITELKQLQEKTLSRQKLESLGVLAGGIAHDFNNLLGSILAGSELVLADLPDGSPAREELERIEAIAVRAAEIVRQLMVYAGHESIVLGPVDMAALVREMVELIKISISKNAVLQLQIPDRLPPVQGNAAQIRQVVMNLITNASDALGGKQGVITVALKQVAGLPPQEPAAGEMWGSCIKLDVCDTGSGMTKETQARIFDPFFTTKTKGRGLGLAAVQGIIRAHGGTIEVVSAPNQGSRFAILLPCVMQAAQSHPATALPAARSSGERVTGTVLVVEDEDTLRLAVGKMLSRKGFSILDAAEGTTAVQLLRTHAMDIDVVLLDVTLPGISGRDILREIHKLQPEMKVILTTAYGPELAREAVGGEHVWHYLRKPYQLAHLTDLVRSACTGVPGASSATG